MNSFSVVMPNYNHGKYLNEALDAIWGQTVKPERVVVVDDDSSDGSLEILRSYKEKEQRVEFLQNEANVGVIATQKRGLDELTTDYIYSLGPDDPICDGFFEKSISLLQKHPQAALCFSDTIREFSDGTTQVVRHHLSDQPRYFSPAEFGEAISRQPHFSIATSSVTWNRKALLDAWLPETIDLKWHFDWFLAFVLAFRHGICYVPEPLQRVRVDNDSFSFGGMRRKQEQKRVVNKMVSLLNTPHYGDVRDFFRIPSVMCRFRLHLLAALKDNKSLDFISFRLLMKIIRAEYYFRKRARQFAGRNDA